MTPRRRLLALAALALALAPLACEDRPTTASAAASASAIPPAPAAPPASAAPRAPASVASAPAAAASSAAPVAPVPGAVSEATARRVLFGTSVPVEASRCEGATRDKIACWLGVRYAGDAQAKALAQELYTSFGTVVGQGEARTMDGAYRGTIRLVPTLPTGQDRKHLVWLHAALVKIDAFQRALAREHGAASVGYRASPLVVEFVRSLDGKRTPSGYASDWTYSYNVLGSLNVSAESVLSLAFHEIFHLNDLDAASPGGGDAARSWSAGALSADVRAILARCKVTTAATAARSTPCLAPYAPTALQVRGGTYYAFQPGNDIVLEYAAELATRVFDEQRALLGLGPRVAGRPFKCGPPENARAWRAMVDKYFGGVDRVPACR